jgi:hypothetical protein
MVGVTMRAVKSPRYSPTAVVEEDRESLRRTGVGLPESRLPRGEQFAQALLLVALYATPALICAHAASVNDPDIWWHLRTGEWILQHHAVPHTDPFSSSGAGKPWSAYSWLFELLVLQLFQRAGLAGLVIYTAGMVLAVTAALHHLIKRLQPDFSIAVLLTLVACLSLVPLYTPRPWMFTILFFVLEVDILMRARTTGRSRELAWLPLIFALWANLHIQFVDGLLVLALALAEAILARWWTGIPTRVRPAWLCAACIASTLATLANPYGWHIYRVAYDLVAQPGVLNKINELQAIPFRSVFDYCLLFLALASAGALARGRRFLPFETAFLAFAAFVSFRSQRDLWVMTTAASAILSSGLVGREKEWRRLPAFTAPLAAVGSCFVLALGFRVMHVNNARLRILLAKDMPVRALEVVKEKGYGGPLYNDYGWGGYLMWDLRLPVIIDGRASLHGDKRIDRSVATWNAQPDWASDSELVSAATVIGPVKMPLIQVLRMDPHFQLVFEDKVAAVFITRK